MRLKEIKQGMVIHCKTQEEANILCGHAGIPDFWGNFWKRHGNATCYRIEGDGDCIYSYGNIDSYVKSNYKITEFSDLILPELTAEETLQVINDICNTYSNYSTNCRDACPFCNGYCKEWMAKHPKETVEICAQWKADHEKKEPEIETVDICRIIEVLPDGRKRCVCEEDMNNPDRTLGDKNYLYDVAEILKRYCMEHDGKFIAVHEVVSRVKAVE